jgi:rod shape determining protein RodA
MRGQYSEFFRRYDYSFFGTATAIFIIGIINLYSATHAETSSVIVNLYKIQIGWYSIAIVIGLLVSFMQPQTIFRYSYAFYGINLVFLVLVLLVGQSAMGGQRWFALGPIRFQPSEMMKLGLILALARYFTGHEANQEVTLKKLLIPAILTLVPAVLIFKQPDLGTGMILFLIFSVMVFYRRLSLKTFFIIGICAVLGGYLMFQYGLKDYQRQRIHTFINPSADARGSGYNAIQSRISIGSGRLLGKGFKKSTQASLSYLPENHTDFVFSVFNEEHGFIGSMILIMLYLILLYRFHWLAVSSGRFFNSVTAIGLLSVFFWHTFINMGMVTGILPIVGIPLPLLSYGGSSLLTFGLSCGIATSMSNSKNIFSS